MRQNLLKSLGVLLLLVLSHGFSLAQGVTSASMQGKVADASGETLPGANVVATHVPSGTRYGSVSNLNGQFVLPNLRVGGPYIVEISFVGYESRSYQGIVLGLGQTYTLNAVLSDGVELETVEVVASNGSIMNADRTGAATNIGTEQLSDLPSISRSVNDFVRLTPQASTAGSGVSFGGQNNRYNQFAIDGTVNNDVFGLAGNGTNGGQTGVNPISLDAIDEVQVVIAPYDVKLGGFTGGGINAVTRSGTNTFDGSVFYFGNNQNLVGKSPNEARTKLDDYTDYQAGFRLGGPIIKNKLFFFVNGEVTRNSSPVLFDPTNVSGGSNVTVDELSRAESVASRLGYDPGSYGAFSESQSSEKIFARLDWNVNDKNKITLRHSYVYGEQISVSRSPNSVNFFNSGVFFPSTTNTSVFEWTSRLSNNMSNELRIGYTSVRDDRNPLGSPFPAVNIRLSGGRSINMGSEAFSVANQLDQDVLTITDNFTVYKGKHTLTFGTHNEFYSTYNLFIRQNYGAYSYYSLEDWESVGTAEEVLPRSYNYSYSRTDNPQQGAEFNAFQLGFYAQDEYQWKSNVKITAGLRLDIPTFSDKPSVNADFNSDFAEYDVATDQVPGAQILVSPRVGFNWDVKEDGNTQVRGGLGLFTGRVPFVWISNQYTNTGNEFGRVALFRSSETSTGDYPEGFMFQPDPFNQADAADVGKSLGVSEINVTDKDFKFPQVFRANAAIDQEFPGGIIGTFEAIYTKNLKNIDFKNLNKLEDGTLSGADDRVYFDRNYANSDFNDVILLTNTNKGFAYNLTAQLQKSFESGLTSSVAYTYGRSKDVNGGTSSQAFSNWRFVEQVNGGNNAEIGFADFDVRSRVVASLGYKIQYSGGSSTTISAFYNGQSGIPFSYVVNGDLNNDRTFGNDLIYIPASQNEIQFIGTQAEQNAQWNAYNAYIENDEYLSEHRGEYAERNSNRLPWTNQVDVRLMHEIKLKSTDETNHRLTFTFDVLNLGNLINQEWGRQYGISNNSFSVIDLDRVDVNGSTRTPVYEYTGSGLNDGKPYFVSDFLSRWRGQIGIRYSFN
ncbi:carboxypeptidase regulatory-like domain-containing protein [Algoriphagus sp. C2-6-M1]|uniref:TonB-dependent receptor n=1 Tax=Algoriphagus persicinus TaxID=3108754 RepID=UPI002B3C7728|nr:carboxypeptidase regulatory-like domain-containing protein [Algoriphagus sp. C2-6-M1]MEB2780302.1 carboxypeptidase regulatory-like domain-containing protein [Algoriphagus sp. C2-6-M1]